MAETIEEAVERLKREAFYDKAPVVACSASDLRSLIRAYEQLVDTVPTLRRMDRTRSIHIAQLGLEAWRSKEHNARWWRKIDGTPIPNDLTICIADAFYEVAETQRDKLAPEAERLKLVAKNRERAEERHRAAKVAAEAKFSALEGVVRGYRAASHWIGADSWDGCTDCMDILRAACAADPDRDMTSDEIALACKNLRSGAIALRDADYLASLDSTVPAEEKPTAAHAPMPTALPMPEYRYQQEDTSGGQALHSTPWDPQCAHCAARFSTRWEKAEHERGHALPAEGEGKAVGWQYRLSQEVANRAAALSVENGTPALGRRWVFAIWPTKEGAERASYGGAEGNPLNEVRPLFAAPSQEPQDARRERYARIIDPKGWATYDGQLSVIATLPQALHEEKRQQAFFYVRQSLAKADLILNSEGAGS